MLESYICPVCGASVAPTAAQRIYCDTYFKQKEPDSVLYADGKPVAVTFGDCILAAGVSTEEAIKAFSVFDVD